MQRRLSCLESLFACADVVCILETHHDRQLLDFFFPHGWLIVGSVLELHPDTAVGLCLRDGTSACTLVSCGEPCPGEWLGQI